MKPIWCNVIHIWSQNQLAALGTLIKSLLAKEPTLLSIKLSWFFVEPVGTFIFHSVDRYLDAD